MPEVLMHFSELHQQKHLVWRWVYSKHIFPSLKCLISNEAFCKKVLSLDWMWTYLHIWEAVKIDLKLHYIQVTEYQPFTGPPSPLSFTKAPLIPLTYISGLTSPWERRSKFPAECHSSPRSSPAFQVQVPQYLCSTPPPPASHQGPGHQNELPTISTRSTPFDLCPLALLFLSAPCLSCNPHSQTPLGLDDSARHSLAQEASQISARRKWLMGPVLPGCLSSTWQCFSSDFHRLLPGVGRSERHAYRPPQGVTPRGRRPRAWLHLWIPPGRTTGAPARSRRSGGSNRTRERSGRTVPSPKSVRHFPERESTAARPASGPQKLYRGPVFDGSDSWPGPHSPALRTAAGTSPRLLPGRSPAEGRRGSPGAPDPAAGPWARHRREQEGKARREAEPQRPEKMEAAPGPGTGRAGQAEAEPASAPQAGQGPGSLTGLGRAAPSQPPRRRRPRPRPPPPRAARSVPAARLGRSAPPLSSACSCFPRRAPAAAAAARADGGSGAPATAASLLCSIAWAAAAAAEPAPPLPSPGSRRLGLSQAAPLPAPGQSPALTCALRSRRGRDVGRRRNAPFGLRRPLATGRTRRRSPCPGSFGRGRREINAEAENGDFLFFHLSLKGGCSAPFLCKHGSWRNLTLTSQPLPQLLTKLYFC